MLPAESLTHTGSCEIELSKLVPFSNYPLELFQGYRLMEMVDILRKTHKCEPILVRPIGNDRYEILNGHYRVAAAKKLGLVTIPVQIFENLSDEEALEYVSGTNPVGLQKKYNVDIYSKNYKKTDAYKKVKKIRIHIDGSYTMALDEYIEKFLLTKRKVCRLYESIYDMGNPYTLNDNECTDEAVAREIVLRTDPEGARIMNEWENSKSYCDALALSSAKQSIESQVTELLNTFTRKDGGYIQQIKKYLNIDLDAFDYASSKNKRERAKFLYFIYMLKTVEFPEVNILKLLSRPSFENVDNSFLGWETSNGRYIGYLKHEIEKEIPLSLKNVTKMVVSNIVNKWGTYTDTCCKQIATLLTYGWKCSKGVDTLRVSMQEPFDKAFVEQAATASSPLELLYLRLMQHEYLGQVEDLLKIYQMTSTANYIVPEKYINGMKRFQGKAMKKEDIETYFEVKNVQKIAEYVYLRSEVNKEDRRKIRQCKEKVLRFLSFLNLADPLDQYNMMGDVTELLIISCLQSILLDGGKEIFDYSFYGMEGEPGARRGKIHVQAALKKEKRPYDALQVFWVRRVMDRYYANVGDKNIREITKECEIICIQCLSKILNSVSIEEMIAMDEFYRTKLLIPLGPICE